jgi:hypothetical protein
MACQAMVFIGLKVSEPLAEYPASNDGDGHFETDVVLEQDGNRLQVALFYHQDSEFEIGIQFDQDNWVGQTVFGVCLNGRYRPVLVDIGQGSTRAAGGETGEGDLLTLSLDKLYQFRNQIRQLKGLENADLIIVHEHF